ncbi:unnamed protein product [Eruca vesicaria subsp. sativa]|uniref:HTH La-type RNA-binding domain-containing protein n=1 Tax=Eruca vesicaria subsp. sativa TaxID=29727 RepID=A0ABC8KD14_ERUVS|nr:unnamed protein product [Eruca vesicaria subsp. sativa]
MATTESSAANSASQIQPGYSIDPSSVSRSRTWITGASGSGAIIDDPCDKGKKKPVWNKPCTSSSPLMGADSWPALSLSSHKSPSLDSSKGLSPMPQAPLSSSINASAATSSDNLNVNSQRKPFRRNNSTSSKPPNAYQRSGSAASQSRRHHNNGSSYPPPGDGLYLEHGHQSGLNSNNGRGDMHLQPQRGFGMMRPQILMGSPSFPASSSTQYMAAPQIGSYGGPMLYPDYALHVFMPHPPPESMTLVGNLAPPPIYFPTFDTILYNKILTQVEYYFSADNLSKDRHLRRQMNDEGWVPVRVIAGFRRLAELTDNIQTILEALRSSEAVETKGEALRRRGDWDKYLLPHEQPSSSGPEAAAGDST